MKNIKKLVIMAGSVAAALALAQSIQAQGYMTGTFAVTGGVTLNTGSAATATAVTSWVSPTVELSSGAFASIGGSAVTFSPSWSFNSVPVPYFLSVGGFTFELISSSLIFRGGTPGATGYVVFSGTGTISAAGYNSTPATWWFSSQDPQASFNPDIWTFSGVVTALPVPFTQPLAITNFSLAGTNIVLRGTNGQSGATAYLLATTNLALPLKQWKTQATGMLGGNAFVFTGTNVVTLGMPQKFYRLSSTNYNP